MHTMIKEDQRSVSLFKYGFNLIELISVMAICSIILGLSAPSFSELLIRNRVSAHLSIISKAVTLARTSSIYKNTVVTLCRSKSYRTCDGTWSKGFMLFTDANKDRSINEDDQLLLKVDNIPEGDNIYWRAFQNRQYLQMNPEGYTRYQNGTFTYCPKEGNQYAKAIIINAAGRVRFSLDTNKDGIYEGANGTPLRC
jgi:type IV fimbrial biogenesis protein FimT